MIDKEAKVYVAGHRGMVGSAVVRALTAQGHPPINIVWSGHDWLDLRDPQKVDEFFLRERPDYVFMCAGTVGGIHANNTFPATFLYDNVMMAMNTVKAAWKFKVTKFIYLGSSCAYPRNAPQPLKEESLWSGPLEPTNAPYACAKLAGIMGVQAYRKQFGFPGICLLPTNLYGPNDNYDFENSHVLPALIAKIYAAREAKKECVQIWGTGKPRREFMHVDDLASACLFLAEHYDSEEVINVGTGVDISIAMLAEKIAMNLNYYGELRYDSSMPDGMPLKRLDVSKINALGWSAGVSLPEGLKEVCKNYEG